MKDLTILNGSVETTLKDSFWRSHNREIYKRGEYKFTNPENTLYSEILSYISNEGMVTRKEIFQKFLLPRISQKGKKIRYTSSYYANFWVSAQVMGILKKYRNGNNYYYTITSEGKRLI